MSELKLQDYIPYYIGCKINKDHDALDYPTIEGIDRGNVIVSGYRYKTPNCESIFNRPRIWKSIDSIKPILRKLEDMLEDEAMLLLRFRPEHEIIKSEKIKNHFCFEYKWKDAIYPSGYGYSEKVLPLKNDYTYKATDFIFLLKSQFDLFGLIDAGLAIDSNTLK